MYWLDISRRVHYGCICCTQEAAVPAIQGAARPADEEAGRTQVCGCRQGQEQEAGEAGEQHESGNFWINALAALISGITCFLHVYKSDPRSRSETHQLRDKLAGNWAPVQRHEAAADAYRELGLRRPPAVRNSLHCCALTLIDTVRAQISMLPAAGDGHHGRGIQTPQLLVSRLPRITYTMHHRRQHFPMSSLMHRPEICVCHRSYGGVVVAKLPFEPRGFFQKITHRGLEGSDPSDAAMVGAPQT